MHKYVIVGSGVAGVTAAQALTRADPGAEVVLLGAEPYPYYQRPRLWALIAGEIEEGELYFRPKEWYAERGIELHLGALVTSLDPQEHRVVLSNGDRLSYDRLLLATGGFPFVPPIEGADKQGVFSLRTLDHARAIKAYAGQVDSALVVGGGLLGLETARALLGPNRSVTVLEIVPHLLPRQLDAPGAAVLTHFLEEMGLRIRIGAQTQTILGTDRATGIRFVDGKETEGGLVILSTGIRSRVDLAQRAGLEVNRGVVVDERLQTSAPDVFAAGDVAEFGGRVYGIIPAAVEQARAAAANMVDGHTVAYTGTIPSTTLKIVGIDLTCLGESTADGPEYTIVRHADQGVGIYKRLALHDGKIVGAILLGDTQDARPLQQLIAAEQEVAVYGNRLVDGSLDLQALAQGKALA
jgi:nitrite reductase (NADH) large subunit